MIESVGRTEVETVLATSQPVPAYGGIRIDDRALQQIVETIRAGRTPMLLDHDLRQPFDATIVDAGIRKRPDGYSEVWIRLDVDSEQWTRWRAELAERAAPGGFSFSVAEPLTTVSGQEGATGEFDLAADAAYWSDADLLAAAEQLRRVGHVRLNRRYAFHHDPTPVVAFYLILRDLGIDIVADAVYDALKRFLLPDRPTVFEFRVVRETETVEARLETSDRVALRNAVESFDRLVNPGGLEVWDVDANEWKPLEP
jgi:hypothetical protein